MGDFNLDDVLSDLGKTDPSAPREPGFANTGGGASANSVGETAGATARAPRPAATRVVAPQAGPSVPLIDKTLAMVFEPLVGSAEAVDLGHLLLEEEIIKPDQLADAVRVMKQTPGKRLEEALRDMGVDDAAIHERLARQIRLPFERIDLTDHDAVDSKWVARLGLEFCRDRLALPLRREGIRAVIGTTRADDVFLLDEIRRRLGVLSVKHVLVTIDDIRGYIETASEEKGTDYNVDQILADVDEDDVEVHKDDKVDPEIEDAESSPVVRYVNHIIQTALKEGASDIHIEPGEKKLKVRFRIDGVLFEMMNPPWRMHAAITSRIKIMANLDIAERRLPQDGRIRATVLGRKLDLRVSTLPTAHGEKTVLRILDNRTIQVTLDQLGFEQDTLTIWKNQIDQPHGIILVTGPTGSGKTTTLYGSLRQMDMQRLNVSTVEDPVEYNLAGITQTQTHEKIGMSFATALKSLLRQDPDVIMVGEIRDLDTATTAIQASLTGHLVLSTLHTNDAPASVTRMINIGIEPFLIGAALNSVLAQRLVRRICADCRVEEPVNPELAEFLVMHGVNKATLPHGKGCSKCRETGYLGRLGLYEMLVLDDFLRDAVARNPNVTEFRRTCSERGMVTLREDGFKKIANGLTTVEEVLRVTESTI